MSASNHISLPRRLATTWLQAGLSPLCQLFVTLKQPFTTCACKSICSHNVYLCVYWLPSIKNSPPHPATPHPLLSLPPLSSPGSFYPINGHWPVDGGSAQPRRVLDWCCLVKEKHTPTHARTRAHKSESELLLRASSEKTGWLLSAALLSFLWASAMYEIKDAK